MSETVTEGCGCEPIDTAPLNVEVLAWHEYGRNWHQVSWNGRHWTMRWHPEFRQFFRDYTHWMPLPPPPVVLNSPRNSRNLASQDALATIRPRSEPCGECHLQPGETCDICGAKDPRNSRICAPQQSVVSSNSEGDA
jgi:hypothetical protein